MTAVLRFAPPVLTTAAGDGSWEPFVELHNPTEEAVDVSGGPVAIAELHRPDGSPVRSRQAEWPIPAVLITHHLKPGGAKPLRLALCLLPDEKASLPPGRYRLRNIRWGQLQATDVDVEISDSRRFT